MLHEEVSYGIAFGLQDHFADRLAALSSLYVILLFKESKQVNLPGNLASCLHHILLIVKLDALMRSLAMRPEFAISSEAFSALGTRHLKGGLEHDLLISFCLH